MESFFGSGCGSHTWLSVAAVGPEVVPATQGLSPPLTALCPPAVTGTRTGPTAALCGSAAVSAAWVREVSISVPPLSQTSGAGGEADVR